MRPLDHAEFWDTGSHEPWAEKPGLGDEQVAPRPVQVSVGEAKARVPGEGRPGGEGGERPVLGQHPICACRILMASTRTWGWVVLMGKQTQAHSRWECPVLFNKPGL